MQIKDILELVQKYVAQYVLDRYMKNISGLDAATSFYLYSRISQLEKMPFDTANLIAKSMNADLKLFDKQGLIKTSKKGKAQGIILLNHTNRELNDKQSLIDCVQFVMTTFAKGGVILKRKENLLLFLTVEMKSRMYLKHFYHFRRKIQRDKLHRKYSKEWDSHSQSRARQDLIISKG